MAPNNDATQPSTAVSADPVSSKVMQSFGFLFSSFSKQPLAVSTPPSNLAMTLLTQSLAFGFVGLPGVSANCSHMSSPVLVLDMHFVLPARHFACCADAGTPVASISDASSTVTIERFVMAPPSSNDRRARLGLRHGEELDRASRIALRVEEAHGPGARRR